MRNLFDYVGKSACLSILKITFVMFVSLACRYKCSLPSPSQPVQLFGGVFITTRHEFGMKMSVVLLGNEIWQTCSLRISNKPHPSHIRIFFTLSKRMKRLIAK